MRALALALGALVAASSPSAAAAFSSAASPSAGLTLTREASGPEAVSQAPQHGAEEAQATGGSPEGSIAMPQAPAPASEAEVAAAIVPPEPLEPFSIPFPAGAPAVERSVIVQILLTIGVDGSVVDVKVAEPAGEPFDSAVVEAARGFRFGPATLGGKPIEVVVPFTQTFTPPAAPEVEAETGAKLDAMLEGIVVERGTRRPARGAVVVVADASRERTATADDQGRFKVAVPSGELKLRVVAQGMRRFVRVETLRPNEHLKVKYLVDRESYDPYQSVVVGTRERTEISRTTLEGREIHQVPGTFGDPFRVVSVLPGVTQVMSLLPMPVVRGSSPGETGIFLDGVRLPLLFHLFAGPSVIHPQFIEKVDFYPGGFPVTYGGYTGGIIDGRTLRPRAESRYDLDLNLTQAGGFVRQPIPGTSLTATVAGRYGYPGLMLSLLNSTLSLSYWDYQARLDGGGGSSTWSVFFLGARDDVKVKGAGAIRSSPDELTRVALMGFHRLDLRWRLGNEERHGDYRVVFGYDQSEFAGQQAGSTSYFAEPQLNWTLPLGSRLKLNTGLEVLTRRIADQPQVEQTVGRIATASDFIPKSGMVVNSGVFVELPWKLLDRLLLVPGVRGDVYTDANASQWSIDPRLTLRYKPLESRELWLKAVVGRYHQPPRLFLQVPGVDQSPLDLGLLASTQTGAGFEAKLGPALELDVQGYYNDMNPVVFDLAVNTTLADVQASGPTSLPGKVPESGGSGQEDVTRLFTRRVGASYGLELMLRKRDTSGVFGWLAYTLSRSVRKYETGWAPFDFDRTHIFNAVAGVRLPRNWEIGSRLLLQSGTPLTSIYGYNSGRADWQFRADLRVDKRAVWNTWLLDFYVDIINSMVSPESGGLAGDFSMRYVMPTVGFRAVL